MVQLTTPQQRDRSGQLAGVEFSQKRLARDDSLPQAREKILASNFRPGKHDGFVANHNGFVAR